MSALHHHAAATGWRSAAAAASEAAVAAQSGAEQGPWTVTAACGQEVMVRKLPPPRSQSAGSEWPAGSAGDATK